jgi:hypothetical protein
MYVDSVFWEEQKKAGLLLGDANNDPTASGPAPSTNTMSATKRKINNRAKYLAISQMIRAKLYNKLSLTCL